ncbi:DNA-binding response regulator [Thalassotalea insulae]|uniref:DNA-binding response regulator n=1 Tax=Thalassotalea insulae TaxID=2056778 RepID=A0ABQ6GU92_9GAMM|nr:response regulator transcription factor [Thalassotalea insulae]GLX79229.1 DNA-binding response regulator [Thalassotalea insulae]
MSKIKLVLADDQNLVRQGLYSLLQLSEQIDVVAQLDDGVGVLDTLARCQPDILLLDIRMPKMSGVEVLAQMKAQQSPVATVILTTFDEHDLVLQCLKLGAKGYLRKDVSFESLISAIKAVYRGDSWIQPAITTKITDKQFDKHSASELAEPLTSGELQVLRLVAAGYSNAEIADALHRSVGTIRNLVSFILAKLQVRDRTRAVLKAIELGVI